MSASPSATAPATAADVVDQTAGLAPADPLYALRREREKIVAATQGSYDAMFSPDVAGVTVAERLLVALHACRASGAHALADHYRARTQVAGASTEALTAADAIDDSAPASPRLRALLTFTGKLIRRPIEGDREAVEALQAAGFTPPAIVAVAQLIAFLSYQIRLQAGLRALAAAGAAA